MPELPEVEIISRDLNKELSTKTIVTVEVADKYETIPGKKLFISEIKGNKIESVSRIAKVIAFRLSNGKFLTFHLAMTGRMLFTRSQAQPVNHLRVRLKFSDQSELRFTDVRMFGYARLLDQKGLTLLKERYGPTPFHKDLNGEKLLLLLTKRNTQVKRVLLEQDIISGVGNIYANDALWIAKIHPETATTALQEEEALRLLEALREILSEGIRHRGSTLDDLMYVDIYGKPGTHQNHFRVYGKSNKPCPRCKTSIAQLSIGGRGTFYCPKCQVKKLPNNQVSKNSERSYKLI